MAARMRKVEERRDDLNNLGHLGPRDFKGNGQEVA